MILNVIAVFDGFLVHLGFEYCRFFGVFEYAFSVLFSWLLLNSRLLYSLEYIRVVHYRFSLPQNLFISMAIVLIVGIFSFFWLSVLSRLIIFKLDFAAASLECIFFGRLLGCF